MSTIVVLKITLFFFTVNLLLAQDQPPVVPSVSSQMEAMFPTQAEVLAEIATGKLSAPGLAMTWEGDARNRISNSTNSGYTLDLEFTSANKMIMTLFHDAERQADAQTICREMILEGKIRLIYQNHKDQYRISVPANGLSLKVYRRQHSFDYMGGQVRFVQAVDANSETVGQKFIQCINPKPIILQVESRLNRDLRMEVVTRKTRGTIEYQTQANVVMAKLGFWPNNGAELLKNWYTEGPARWHLDLDSSILILYEGSLKSGRNPVGETIFIGTSGLNTQLIRDENLYFPKRSWNKTEGCKRRWGLFFLKGTMSIKRMEIVAVQGQEPVLKLIGFSLSNGSFSGERLGAGNSNEGSSFELNDIKRFDASVVESPLPQFNEDIDYAGYAEKRPVNEIKVLRPVFKELTTAGCLKLRLGNDLALIGQAKLEKFSELGDGAIAGTIIVDDPMMPIVEGFLSAESQSSPQTCSSEADNALRLDSSQVKLEIGGSWPLPSLKSGSSVYLRNLRLGSLAFKDFVRPRNVLSVITKGNNLELKTMSYFKNFLQHEVPNGTAHLDFKGVEPRLYLEATLHTDFDKRSSNREWLVVKAFSLDYPETNIMPPANIQSEFSIGPLFGGTIIQKCLPFRLELVDGQTLTLDKGILSGNLRAKLKKATLKSAFFNMDDFLRFTTDLESETQETQVLVPIGGSTTKHHLLSGSFRRTSILMLNGESPQNIRKKETWGNSNETANNEKHKGSVFKVDNIYISGMTFQQTAEEATLTLKDVHILGTSEMKCGEQMPSQAFQGVFSFEEALGRRKFEGSNRSRKSFLGKFTEKECFVRNPEFTSENPEQTFQMKTGALLDDGQEPGKAATPSDAESEPSDRAIEDTGNGEETRARGDETDDPQVDGADDSSVAVRNNAKEAGQQHVEQAIPLDEESNRAILEEMGEPDFAVFLAKNELADLWNHMLKDFKLNNPQEIELDLYQQTMEVRVNTQAGQSNNRTKGNYYLDLFRDQKAVIFRTRKQLVPSEASENQTLGFKEYDEYLCTMLGRGITRFSYEGFQINFPSLFSFETLDADTSSPFQIEHLAVLVDENGLYFLGTVQKETALEGAL